MEKGKLLSLSSLFYFLFQTIIQDIQYEYIEFSETG
jgi:hypothetical protein